MLRKIYLSVVVEKKLLVLCALWLVSWIIFGCLLIVFGRKIISTQCGSTVAALSTIP